MVKITPPRIVIVSTSLSTESRSRILCRHALDLAQEREMDVEFIDLQDFRVLPYGVEGSQGLEEIEKRLGAAEGILLGFPLYTFNMNATLKALMEWRAKTSRNGVFRINIPEALDRIHHRVQRRGTALVAPASYICRALDQENSRHVENRSSGEVPEYTPMERPTNVASPEEARRLFREGFESSNRKQ